MSPPPFYPFRDIERRWQARWYEAGIFHADPVKGKPKWFLIELAPFANGKLHLGHVRNYTLADATARFRRQAGFNVLYTGAFDAFGLPNDQGAREKGCHPEALARKSIQEMSAQFVSLGLSHDPRRIISYHEPCFYHWVQFVFLKLLEHGLMVRNEHRVNWCPSCKTTVEEGLVDHTGGCWRCGSSLEGRRINQWFVLEAEFLDESLKGLDKLEYWPKRVKDIQRQMFSRRCGVRIEFTVPSLAVPPLQVFLDDPELLPAVSFVGVGARHAVITRLRQEGRIDPSTEMRLESLAAGSRSADRRVRRKRFQEVDAIHLGVDVLHPLTNRPIPLLAVSLVDPWSDTKAVAGVPAHQRCDQKIARELGLEVRPMIKPRGASGLAEVFEWDDRATVVDDGPWDGRTVAEARKIITAALEQRGKGGAGTEMQHGSWHWSRKRYWGTPIPIIYCPDCGVVPVPESDLPVRLPMDIDLQAGTNPLELHLGFLNAPCPACGGPARRETDTLDVYTTSWWYLWTCKAINHDCPFTSADKHYWMPIDLMIGGVEQSTTCYLHCRSLARMLVRMGLDNWEEPIQGLLAIGMVKHDGEKMSKSKGNAEDLAPLIDSCGADALRLAILGAAAPESDFNWERSIIRRAHRVLTDLWVFVTMRSQILRFDALTEDATIETGTRSRRQLKQWIGAAVARITNNMGRHQFHMAVKNIHRLFESIQRYESGTVQEHGGSEGFDCEALSIAVRTLLLTLAPIAPHICEELWQRCGGSGFIATAPWPQVPPTACPGAPSQQGERTHSEQPKGR
jgi:leucyl-tRNA synthetase